MLPPAETQSDAELIRAVGIGLAAADRGETTTITLDEVPEFLARLGETGKRLPEA